MSLVGKGIIIDEFVMNYTNSLKRDPYEVPPETYFQKRESEVTARFILYLESSKIRAVGEYVKKVYDKAINSSDIYFPVCYNTSKEYIFLKPYMQTYLMKNTSKYPRYKSRKKFLVQGDQLPFKTVDWSSIFPTTDTSYKRNTKTTY